ncbi:MAG: TetR family transcriptional regulator C-terminal domain-containing protein [Oscillospiraceae bacterium]|nr:TetR family transcriptional regulator C-terminal domain-containing protein [Oscillospiraceae bacterium]
MNTKNNRRRRDSVKRIEDTFLRLLEERELESITVSELCKECNLNRSTFYANFLDIYDLADHIRDRLEAEVAALYQEEREEGRNSNDFLKLFRHIRDNQIFYRIYFKLGYADQGEIGSFQYDPELARRQVGDKHIQYHMEFFRKGLNAIIKMWLLGGCKETPEEMNQILEAEYRGRIPS